MLKEKLKKYVKIENIVVLIVILIITTIAINYILKEDKSTTKNENTTNTKILADIEENEINKPDLQSNLEKILSTIKGVGKVNVFISYSESSKTIAMYDEKTTTSSTEETDSSRRTEKYYINRSTKRCYFF